MTRLQPLVREVDAELLERIVLRAALKPKEVEHADAAAAAAACGGPAAAESGSGCGGSFDVEHFGRLLDEPRKGGGVERLRNCTPPPDPAPFPAQTNKRGSIAQGGRMSRGTGKIVLTEATSWRGAAVRGGSRSSPQRFRRAVRARKSRAHLRE